jgi:hypothetical protein
MADERGTPTSTSSGQGGGHALYRSPTAYTDPDASRDNLLQTPPRAEDFAGSPYPAPGLRVHGTGGNPPWLVVDHYTERMIVRRWPVRLWRVCDIEAASPENQVNHWYTRTISFEIAEEVPAWHLFGEHGLEVASVIESVAELRQQDVDVLSVNRPDDAGTVYSDFWRRWQPHSAWGSPVGHALSLIHEAVERAAKMVSPSLFRHDPIDGVDVLGDRTWIAAEAALLEAALGLGAPQLIDEKERALLTRAWRCWSTSS